MDIGNEFDLEHLLFVERTCRMCGERKNLLDDFGKTKNCKVHSLLYYTYYDKTEKKNYSIDHINRIRDDNRLENLREISIKEQIKNRVKEYIFIAK